MLEHLAGAAHEATDVYRQEVIALLLPEVRGNEAAFVGERDALEVVGQGLKTIVYMPEKQEPELMYKLFDGVVGSLDDLIESLKR